MTGCPGADPRMPPCPATRRPRRDRRATPEQRRSVVVLTVLGLAVLVGGAYAAAYAVAGEKVPRGTTVAGIDIGGKTHDEAVRALEDGFADREELDVTVDGGAAPMTAADGRPLGRLRGHGRRGRRRPQLGARAAVGLLHRRRRPRRRRRRRRGRAGRGAGRARRELGSPAKEGDVRFEDGNARPVAATDGEEVDRRRPREAITAAYVDGDAAELTLATAEPDIEPGRRPGRAQRVRQPGRLRSGDAGLRQDPGHSSGRRTSRRRSAMEPEDGELVPDLDEKKLAKLVRSGSRGPTALRSTRPCSWSTASRG